MDFEYLKIVLSVIIAVIGWIIAHYFTSKRDVSNKKREIRLNYLIEVYLILTNDLTERGNIDSKKAEIIEKIISQVQLLGSKKQVELVKTLADSIGKGEIIEYDTLINSLRDDLRKELELEKIEGNVHWARFNI
ncbi:hypothetical protein [Aliarcobacter butzleri]|uniref:Uncharacterized protein n=1 Tax=Aliarcobacter butzleri L355 TaxID=1447263 RepID=A0A0G9KPT0_9BACT|nr:hypothetical protein [Aliarcobacter butzleri]KLE08579.1 hypothetical protein AF80_08525 [Aliarcobacter butzleri L355]MBF7069803.1 hypothetical protein [Aliarcobacter butzleri]MCG3691583.1 hypothetical protein [Aliarcobacter butzleri]MCT7647154.1 hypothetical protein [Aliarcobacter butzleri]